MATDHLQIPDITASQNQKEVTANAAHNLLDRAQNQLVQKTVAGGVNTLTTTEARENGIVEAIGTPGSAWFLDMPDTNERMLTVFNSTDDQGTIRNSASGGAGNPVIEIGEASIFHYDGLDFIDVTAAAIAATSWLSLTDTPSVYTGQSGLMSQVNIGESALEFVMQTMKRPVVAATTIDAALATEYENGDVVDGVTLVTGDRILIKNQSAGLENGVYIVEVSGTPTRAEDFDADVDVQGGVMVPVNNEGTANGDTIWVLSDDDVVVVDTDALVFVLFGSVGTFSGLSDTPGSMAGESGTRLVPNNAETALVYEGTPYKDPVVVATTAALTLVSDVENGDTIDGIVLVTGDRVLVKDQGDGTENGIYIVEASGVPTRSDDFDDDKDAVLGCVVAVNEGDVGAQTLWQLSNITAVTIGSTAQVWAKMQPAVGFMPLALGSLRDIATDEISSPLDDTTTPAFERINGATDKGLRVIWGLSNNDEVAFPEVYMPPDIDTDQDITVHIVGEMSGVTDTPTIDVLVFDSSGDTEMGGVTATFTDTRAEKTVTISAADITGHPLGWLSISLIPVGAHATDTLAIFSVWIEYTRKTA